MATNRRKRTVEDITKSNLNRTLSKMKVEVAEKEEVWLDLYQLILPMLLGEDCSFHSSDELCRRVKVAREITDLAHRQYEERWG